MGPFPSQSSTGRPETAGIAIAGPFEAATTAEASAACVGVQVVAARLQAAVAAVAREACAAAEAASLNHLEPLTGGSEIAPDLPSLKLLTVEAVQLQLILLPMTGKQQLVAGAGQVPLSLTTSASAPLAS